jgi:hypothetical protein
MEGESSLPCSQQPTTSPCFGPDGSKPRTDFVSLWSLLSHLTPGLPNDLFLLGSHRKHFCANFLRRSSRGSVVGIASTLRTGRSGVRISVARGNRFFSFPERLDPPTLLLSQGLSDRGVKLTSHLHLLAALRMNGAIPPLELTTSASFPIHWTVGTIVVK